MTPPAPNPSTLGYFTGLAKVYADCRPTYPREAIDAILNGPTPPLTIADIGCGTGISSRLLASARPDAKVIGVDPNEDMLGQARLERSAAAHGSTIDYQIGTGENTGLADLSVDVVVCAQSFHWFDAPAALREFHRILKPYPGRLALVWNVRDDRDSFTAAYGDIVRRAQEDAERRGRSVGRDHHGDPTIGGLFGNAATRVFTNAQELDLDGLLGRIRSASYFPKQDNPLRSALEMALQQQFERHQRDGRVSLNYRTEVTLAQRV
jgi:ubiquinone/menaquinone biosynthesis C-methylase UbiE